MICEVRQDKSPHYVISKFIIFTQYLLPVTAALTTFLLVLTLFMNMLSPTHPCISSISNFYPDKNVTIIYFMLGWY